MKININSDTAQAEVVSFGAQLTSLKDKSGTEYLWQGDEKYWKGQAPILFPIVGSLRNGRTIINEKEYSMSRHGFARNSEFELFNKKDNSVSFILKSNSDTKVSYPFDFELIMTYTVEGETLTTTFTVKNLSSEAMPFVVGGHPAFNCPILSNECFEDYVIEFDKDNEISYPVLDKDNGLIHFDNRKKLSIKDNIMALDHSMFYDDALVLDELNSRSVKLYNIKSGRGVKVDYKDFSFLGIWSAINDAPFIAIEPWTGCASGTDESDYFDKKRGMTFLNPKENISFSFKITII